MVSGCAGSSSTDPSGLRATFAQRELEQNPSVTLEAHARGGEFFRCSGPRRNLQVAFSSPTIETTQTAAKLLPEVLFFFFLKRVHSFCGSAANHDFPHFPSHHHIQEKMKTRWDAMDSTRTRGRNRENVDVCFSSFYCVFARVVSQCLKSGSQTL